MAKPTIIYVLIYDPTDVGETGNPVVAFTRKLSHHEIYEQEVMPAESVADVTELFQRGALHWERVRLYKV